MTEKRVTRTVIRRRAKVETAQPEVKTKADSVAEERSPSAQEETAMKADVSVEGAKPKKAKPSTKAAAPKKGHLKKVAKKAEPEGLELSKDDSKAESEESKYQSGYKRIKVVASPPVPEAVDSPSAPKVAQPTPVESSIGRREIIEVRHFQKPGKGGRKRRLTPGKKGKKTEITTPKASKRVVRIGDAITVSDLAKKMSVKVGEVIRKLIGMGMMVTINQSIDTDTATLVASEFGFEVENISVQPDDLLSQIEVTEDNPADLVTRPPVVTVMGHVDHGKTSLLDSIRKAKVAEREAGGITQHIGAYVVSVSGGKSITFIDTPGHEAFTAMRARGAQVTDICILVVAADDGVMPQTKEAVNHAKSAGVPIIVAVNKMDKEGADIERVKKALTEFEMVPEEWGGDTIFAPVSALTGEGVDNLLEMILLQAEVLELKANPKRLAKGVIIESQLDKRRGPVSTVLIQNGTLKEGDMIVAGSQAGRIRAMNNDHGNRVREAGPSVAVEILGLSGVTSAGDELFTVGDEKKAKQVADLRQKITRDADLARTSKVSLEDLYSQISQGDIKELKVIVKADAMGSVEVLTDSLHKLSTPKVAVKVIHGAVGGLTENDVNLAMASNAILVGFNVRPDSAARISAERQKVEINLYQVIYELTEDITKAMAGLLAPREVEKMLGRAEVRDVFSIPKLGTVAGCNVVDGKMQRSAHVRLVRESVPIYEGKMASLRRFKDDVKEVPNGMECGVVIENYNDVKVGDVIEAYEIEEIQASLE
jgi:translation initiation factor IF-2